MEDFNLKKYLAENKLLDEQRDKGYPARKAIMLDLMDKLPQFRTIDTPPEFLDLMESLIDILIDQVPDFVESGRFIQSMVSLYNKRKDFQKKAQDQADKDDKGEESGVDPEVKALNDKGIYTPEDARRAGLRLSSDMKRKLGG